MEQTKEQVVKKVYVRNIGKKPIGFGCVGESLNILPGETAPLPEGFDENHPTVKSFVRVKFLKIISKSEKAPEPEELDGDNGEDDGDFTESLETRIAKIKKLGIDKLRGEALILGIEWDEKDTKPVLLKKVIEKLNELSDQEPINDGNEGEGEGDGKAEE